ncbi:MerR family transcriptional regulator [Bacillus tianshenii]|nr:MerR family transcriptional regulator [Bacillus tianshenii]
MVAEEGKYNIKAVSKILGVQAGTLRAWERRYQIIAPKRNEAGHRLYTERHVRILRWLVDKVNQGFTISQAVSLLESNGMDENTGFAEELKGNRLLIAADELTDALLQFNERRAREILNYAFSIFSLEQVMINVLGSVLLKIGDLWENGKTTTAHEHFASAFLRSQIGSVFQSMPVDPVLPKAVAVCGPNEEHELGLFIFTLFLRRKGYDVLYLGTSIAEDDIYTVLDQVEPRYLFMSCTLSENAPKALQTAVSLKKVYPKLSIGIGGHAIESLDNDAKQKHAEFIIGTTKQDWEDWLQQEQKND